MITGSSSNCSNSRLSGEITPHAPVHLGLILENSLISTLVSIFVNFFLKEQLIFFFVLPSPYFVKSLVSFLCGRFEDVVRKTGDDEKENGAG